MKPDLLAVGTGQTILRSTLFEKKGSNDQSINDESLAKLEKQQANLENCLAASFDIGAVQGSYLNNQREESNKIYFHGNLTNQGLTVNWNHVQSFSGERVMGSTSRVNLCLLCWNFSEFRTSQFYLWRPGLRNASSRTKRISPFYIIKPIRNNAYQRGLQGKCNLILNFDITNLVPSIAGKAGSRTNLFEEGGDDVIMESTKEWKYEPEPEEIVAEYATLKNAWKQEVYISLGQSLIIQDTFKLIII